MKSRKQNAPVNMSITRGANGCPTPQKIGYSTRAAAKKVARKFQMQGRRGEGSKLAVYLCSCGFFHIGNQAKNSTRAEYRERIT